MNENDITESCNVVKAMVGNLHNLPYFKVVESTKAYFMSAQNTKAKYGDFLNKFFTFKSQRQAEAFEAVQKDYLLLIADISASHFAIKSTLNNIRALNPKCEIIVFCGGFGKRGVALTPGKSSFRTYFSMVYLCENIIFTLCVVKIKSTKSFS